MSDWPCVPLGDVVTINPRAPKGILPSLNVSFVPMAAVDEVSGTIANPQIRAFSTVAKGFPIFAEDDVLFAKITPCMENGKAALATGLCNGIGAGSTEFFVLRTGDRALAAYVYHFLRRQPFRDACKANFTGSAGQQRVPRSFLEKAPIPLPPLDEQRRIVALLDRAEAIRRRADTARQTARALIPALFTQTFGDPATNPKGWKMRALKDLADIGSGLTKGRKMNGAAATPTPYLRVANVQAGYLDLSEIKLIDATEDDRRRCRLEPGDLLMTEGGDIDKLGRCAMWRGEVETCLHQNHVFRVRMGREVLPDYARAFMQSDTARGYFLRVAKRTTGIASINKTQLGRLPVWVPPLPLQTAFAAQARRIEAMARALDTATAKAEATAAALSARLFGQTRPPA